MEIDWKRLAASPGYKSLKAAYSRDLRRRERPKETLYAKFQWVINRAKHYAHHQGCSVERVLDAWEAKRDYWWLNFYRDDRQPKIPTGKPRNVAPIHPLNYYRRDNWYGPIQRFKMLRREKARFAREMRKLSDKKPRWTADRKLKAAIRREYRK